MMVLIAAFGHPIAVAAESGDMCVLQKNTILEEHKLSILDDMFGEMWVYIILRIYVFYF